MSATTRRQRIIQLLRHCTDANAVTISELYQILQNEGYKVSRKTVDRDIQYLSIEYGITSTEHGIARYYIPHDYQTAHKIALTAETLQTTLIALNQLRDCSHPYFKDIAAKAQVAIMESLDPNIREELNKNIHKYYFEYGLHGASDQPNNNNMRNILYALREERSFSCYNHSPYRDTRANQARRNFAPLVFILSANIPYLIVEDVESKQLKKLRINRLKDIRIENPYTPIHSTKDLHLENMIGGFGGIAEDREEITIKCKKIMATYFMERKIHGTQRIMKLSEDEYKIQFTCAPSSEITTFLSTFSDQIISIEPKYILEDIISLWERGLEAHDDDAA